MGMESKIEWTSSTFNPWIGCQKVSPACTNCYAAESSPTRVSRSIGLELWGPETAGAVRRVTSEENWKMPYRWNRHAVKTGQRLKVFCASLADVFEDYNGKIVDHNGSVMHLNSIDTEGVFQWSKTNTPGSEPLTLKVIRFQLFRMIEATPNLDWQLLTKRPENVMDMVPDEWKRKFPDNVWMGTTVENQKYADERIPHLLEIPARIRFLSMEPLVGPVEFSDVTNRSDAATQLGKVALSGIHWVITGGESGEKARPAHPDWYRSLRDQCQAAGVPFFFKQWGEWLSFGANSGCIVRGEGPVYALQGARVDNVFYDAHTDAVEYDPSDDGVIHVRVGKHNAGRMLDGKEWSEFPS